MAMAAMHLSKFTADGQNIAETGKPQLVDRENDDVGDKEESTEEEIGADASRNATKEVIGTEDEQEEDWNEVEAAGAHLDQYLPTYTGADETVERFSTMSSWSAATAM